MIGIDAIAAKRGVTESLVITLNIQKPKARSEQPEASSHWSRTTKSPGGQCDAPRLKFNARAFYQSNRTVSPIVRGAMVPAASPVPVATYLPVFTFVFCELFGPVNVKLASMLVNCTSLNTL